MLTAVNTLGSLQLVRGDKTVWANEDLPIEKRVPRAFLFGCKKLLGTWGYKRSLVQVDPEASELSINGQPCISATVEGNQLKVTYKGDFTNWTEFKGNCEVQGLQQKASNSLDQAGQGLKGVGKGAPH